MATGLEIVVGTYEEFLLGYRVRVSKSNDRKYDMYQSFSTHSHTSSIRTVASNGKIAASGGADDRICIYDLEARRELDDLYMDATVNHLEFVPDGSYLISGGADGRISFIKSKNWKIDKVFKNAHKGGVTCLSVHATGKLALSIGSDMVLRTWNLINGRQAFATSLKHKSFGTAVDLVVWSKSGDYFAISGKDVIEVWSTGKAEAVASKRCEARPTALCWLTDNDLLVGMENGKLLFFNCEDESEDATLCEIYESRVKAMKYQNGYLVTASSTGELNLWKVLMDQKVEIEMICGIDVGCRIICVDIVDLCSAGIKVEIKEEENETLRKTQVRTLNTKGSVVIEVDEEEEEDAEAKRLKRKNKKLKNNSTEVPKKKMKKIALNK